MNHTGEVYKERHRGKVIGDCGLKIIKTIRYFAPHHDNLRRPD
jgi:hypothetical protein